MKKLRMIVTSVVVLAIVGSAFAFHAKVGSFCIVTTDAANTVNCTTFLTNLKITSSLGTQYKYYPTFDGDRTACSATGNGLCTATFRLAAD